MTNKQTNKGRRRPQPVCLEALSATAPLCSCPRPAPAEHAGQGGAREANMEGQQLTSPWKQHPKPHAVALLSVLSICLYACEDRDSKQPHSLTAGAGMTWHVADCDTGRQKKEEKKTWSELQYSRRSPVADAPNSDLSGQEVRFDWHGNVEGQLGSLCSSTGKGWD